MNEVVMPEMHTLEWEERSSFVDVLSLSCPTDFQGEIQIYTHPSLNVSESSTVKLE